MANRKSAKPSTAKQREALVTKLMSIPGTSGDEAGVASFIRKQLLAAGLPSDQIKVDNAFRKTPIHGNTGNVIVKLPGSYKASRRLLSAHMDTVPICVGSKPIKNGRKITSKDASTGLGADDRAGVAVTLHAATEILRRQLPHPPLTFCWFIQEEIGIQGAHHIQKSLLGNPKMGFNWDGGSATKLTIGATGGYRLEITITGLASHAGGAPEWGVSAIAIASLAISDLVENGWHGNIQKGKNHGTSNVGIIRGGNATNVVTDHVYVKAEARSHNPTFRERIVREIEKAFKKAVKRVKNVAGATGSIEFSGVLDYDSFCLDRSEPCVQTAMNVVRQIGSEPELAIANGGIDANWLVKHGIPTVSFGCGQQNPHTVHEALDLDYYEQACDIALRIAQGDA